VQAEIRVPFCRADLPVRHGSILHFVEKRSGKPAEKHSKCRIPIAILQESLYNYFR